MSQQTTVLSDALKAIRSVLGDKQPSFGIVLGSGCGSIIEMIDHAIEIPYADIPGMAKPSVKGHGGRLLFGSIAGVNVVCFQGRNHWYEGSDPALMRLSISLMKQLGCEHVILTNAVGSLMEDWLPGQLVLITDHINFQGKTSLLGLKDMPDQSIFVSLDRAYDAKHRDMMLQVALKTDVDLKQGVYLATLGPNFETPAEIKAFRTLGASVVGMSTVSEVIAARYHGLRVAVVSMVTNLAAGLSETNLSHEQTLQGATLGVDQLRILLEGFMHEYATQQQANETSSLS